MHKTGQRSFKLLALISSPQHIQPNSILHLFLGQTRQTQLACLGAQGLQEIIHFSQRYFTKEQVKNL